jgi:hypothetical protein
MEALCPRFSSLSFVGRKTTDIEAESTCGFENFDPALQSPVVLFERTDQIISQFLVISLSENFAL